jgi:hypothetical protein
VDDDSHRLSRKRELLGNLHKYMGDVLFPVGRAEWASGRSGPTGFMELKSKSSRGSVRDTVLLILRATREKVTKYLAP